MPPPPPPAYSSNPISADGNFITGADKSKVLYTEAAAGVADIGAARMGAEIRFDPGIGEASREGVHTAGVSMVGTVS